MPDIILADHSATLETVIVERKRLVKEKHPDLELVDSITLKSGPQAYKVATHWAIVNRHTGELHHHAVKVETFTHRKAGWIWTEMASVTLEEGKNNEISALIAFMAAALNTQMPNAPGKYLIVPIEDNDTVAPIKEETLQQFLELSQQAGTAVFSKLLSWATQAGNIDEVIQKLEILDIDRLQRLNTLAGITSLRRILTIWESNKDNDNEEFWQTTLAQNSFVFSQVFSFPVIVIDDKAYVGGKGIENKGGNILDFLCINHLTTNAALIEIKTPKTKLLGSQYRGDVFNISPELSGAVIQVSNYKDSLCKEYDRLSNGSSTHFEAFNPKCMVILGNATGELTNKRQRKSLELFRNGLKDVEVITFDELFGKVETLLNLLEGR